VFDVVDGDMCELSACCEKISLPPETENLHWTFFSQMLRCFGTNSCVDTLELVFTGGGRIFIFLNPSFGALFLPTAISFWQFRLRNMERYDHGGITFIWAIPTSEP